ncbi:MAG: TRAP transporter small permease [Rhodospirillales bacterium]
MPVLRSLNRQIEKALKTLLAAMFAAMVGVVFLQVVSRNILEMTFIGILDIAQLLFSWCIFLGAALAVRWDAHYNLDLVPEHWHKANTALKAFGHAASLVVVYVLAVHGYYFAVSGSTQEVVSLQISGTWLFIPIPIGGTLMLLFLIEMIPDEIAAIRRESADRKAAGR